MKKCSEAKGSALNKCQIMMFIIVFLPGNDVLATVEKAVAASYNNRLDRYPYDPEARIFACEK